MARLFLFVRIVRVCVEKVGRQGKRNTESKNNVKLSNPIYAIEVLAYQSVHLTSLLHLRRRRGQDWGRGRERGRTSSTRERDGRVGEKDEPDRVAS